MPRWPKRGDNSTLFDLPNLVQLNLYDCSELLSLPWQVGKLHHLKTLRIRVAKNMQYFVNANMGGESSFFPSLSELELSSLDNLKGWWQQQFGLEPHVINSNKDGSSQEPHLRWVSSLRFLQLRRLFIQFCPKLIHIPTCPRLEFLNIDDYSRTLSLQKERIPCHDPSLSPPMTMTINNMEYLWSIPTEYLQCVGAIRLKSLRTMEFLAELTEFTHFFSSIRSLHIYCPKLITLGGWVEHLSALEDLDITHCHNLVLAQIPWQHLSRSLQCLTLSCISELEELPEMMQYCTSLESLTLSGLSKMKSLPKWMPKLVSLRKLQIRWCTEMVKERCQQPDGVDWPLIQHIPLTSIQTKLQEENYAYLAYKWTEEDKWY